MSCKPQIQEYYDLKLLSLAHMPIDTLIRSVSSRNLSKLTRLRTSSRIWDTFYEVTPSVVDAFTEEGYDHISAIKQNSSVYGYLYFVAEHNGQWYNAAQFDYQQFPLMRNRDCVLRRIRKMAQSLSKPNTSEFDATCLYLLYFYALLVNPLSNWITIDYLANGNRYHQFGTRLKGKMKTIVKKVWT